VFRSENRENVGLPSLDDVLYQIGKT